MIAIKSKEVKDRLKIKIFSAGLEIPKSIDVSIVKEEDECQAQRKNNSEET